MFMSKSNRIPVTLHITKVKKHKPVIDLEELRDATQEESECVNQYIESISEETDVNFNDCYE